MNWDPEVLPQAEFPKVALLEPIANTGAFTKELI